MSILETKVSKIERKLKVEKLLNENDNENKTLALQKELRYSLRMAEGCILIIKSYAFESGSFITSQ